LIGTPERRRWISTNPKMPNAPRVVRTENGDRISISLLVAVGAGEAFVCGLFTPKCNGQHVILGFLRRLAQVLLTPTAFKK
jgi:hypothetical protein